MERKRRRRGEKNKGKRKKQKKIRNIYFNFLLKFKYGVNVKFNF